MALYCNWLTGLLKLTPPRRKIQGPRGRPSRTPRRPRLSVTSITSRIMACYLVCAEFLTTSLALDGFLTMLGRFNEIFGIHEDLSTEQRRFVERINQTAFPHIEDLAYAVSYESIFKRVCYWLGTNANDRIAQHNYGSYGSRTIIPNLRSLTHDDYLETLRVLVLLFQALDKSPGEQEELSGWIEAALGQATVDLCITWNEGMFYPSGAQELDESLIEESLRWLASFPNERADYMKALTGYANKRLDEVIINCYLAVEGIARRILDNKKTLDNNREELIKKIGLSQEWKALLSNFINYANEFKRHASEKRHNLNPVEVEGFLYMSGVILRMAILATNDSRISKK
jgi:hypothetical protein